MVLTWLVFTDIFIITYFWNQKRHSGSTHTTRTKNQAFLGFLSVIKTSFIQKGHNLVIFYRFFIITCFWNWNSHSGSTDMARIENWAFMGFFLVIKTTVIKKCRNLVISYRIVYYNLFLELEQLLWIHRRLGFSGHFFSKGCK